MTELRKRMIECLQLSGLSERTQEAYVRAVRQLSEHYHKSDHSPHRSFSSMPPSFMHLSFPQVDYSNSK